AVIAVHLKGSFALTRAAAPRFREQRWGRFINMTSTSGLIGNVGQANYAAAKLGIFGLTKATALDMGRYNVTANCISPFAWTRMIGTIPTETETQKARVEKIKKLSPAHIAPVAAFLASDAAKDVSGQVFGVRGKEIMLVGHERPIMRVHDDAGWTVERLVEMFPGTLQHHLVPLVTSGQYFNYDPLVYAGPVARRVGVIAFATACCMALVQALLAMVFRSAGKLLNPAFGWATVLLFGRVPEARQISLSGVAFGSVLWLIALVGVAFPAVASFLVSFVSPPE